MSTSDRPTNSATLSTTCGMPKRLAAASAASRLRACTATMSYSGRRDSTRRCPCVAQLPTPTKPTRILPDAAEKGVIVAMSLCLGCGRFVRPAGKVSPTGTYQNWAHGRISPDRDVRNRHRRSCRRGAGSHHGVRLRNGGIRFVEASRRRRPCAQAGAGRSALSRSIESQCTPWRTLGTGPRCGNALISSSLILQVAAK